MPSFEPSDIGGSEGVAFMKHGKKELVDLPAYENLTTWGLLSGQNSFTFQNFSQSLWCRLRAQA